MDVAELAESLPCTQYPHKGGGAAQVCNSGAWKLRKQDQKFKVIFDFFSSSVQGQPGLFEILPQEQTGKKKT